MTVLYVLIALIVGIPVGHFYWTQIVAATAYLAKKFAQYRAEADAAIKAEVAAHL